MNQRFQELRLPRARRLALFLALAVALIACCAHPTVAQTTEPAPASQPAAPLRPTLLAYGSPDRYWVASIDTYRDGGKALYKTQIREQSLPAGDWKDLGIVFGHPLGLAESQGELAILLDDGSWKRLSATTLTTGPAIPGTGPVMAWGSAGGTLYAVRAVEGGSAAVTTRPIDPPPATRPTTTRASTQSAATTRSTAAAITTRPTTLPVRVALLRFDKGQWQGVADVPAGASGGLMSLGGIGANPLLASAVQPDVIRTFAWVDSKWQELGDVRTDAPVGRFGVLSPRNLAAIWAGDAKGGLKLFVKREGEPWAPLTGFKPPADAPSAAQRTFAAAGEEFRLAFLQDGKFQEQRYDLTGAPRGALTSMPPPQTHKPDPFLKTLQYFVLLGMVVVLVVTFYKRRSTPIGKDQA